MDLKLKQIIDEISTLEELNAFMKEYNNLPDDAANYLVQKAPQFDRPGVSITSAVGMKYPNADADSVLEKMRGHKPLWFTEYMKVREKAARPLSSDQVSKVLTYILEPLNAITNSDYVEIENVLNIVQAASLTADVVNTLAREMLSKSVDGVVIISFIESYAYMLSPDIKKELSLKYLENMRLYGQSPNWMYDIQTLINFAPPNAVIDKILSMGIEDDIFLPPRYILSLFVRVHDKLGSEAFKHTDKIIKLLSDSHLPPSEQGNYRLFSVRRVLLKYFKDKVSHDVLLNIFLEQKFINRSVIAELLEELSVSDDLETKALNLVINDITNLGDLSEILSLVNENSNIVKKVKFLLKKSKLAKNRESLFEKSKKLTFPNTGLAEIANNKNDIMSLISLTEIEHHVEFKEQKHWYFVRDLLFDNYMAISGKNANQFYHEYMKHNSHKLPSIANDLLEHPDEVTELQELAADSAYKAKNSEDYMKYMSRLAEAAEYFHNDKRIPKGDLRNLFLNKSIDLEQNYVENYLEIKAFLAENFSKLEFVLNKVTSQNPKLIDRNKFHKLLEQFEDIDDKIRSKEKIDLSRKELLLLIELSTEVSKIENAKALAKYYSQAEEKNEKLYRLNLKLGEYEFSVLETLDPYAFKVGVDTDCCQRIGGVGEAAAVDSFINPLASVLVLKRNGRILAQSYFHYVPEENGYILDNIEVNEENLKKNYIDINGVGNKSTPLSKIYIKFAQAVKSKYPDIKYINVGLGNSWVDTELFEMKSSDDDPRYFAVDDPYSDYYENSFIDLLQPKTAEKQSYKLIKLLKIAYKLSKRLK